MPVKDLLGFRAHIELEVTDCVAAVRQKCHLLVHLHALRLQDLKQAPSLFGVERLHKVKALAGGGPSSLFCLKARVLSSRQ
jgi:hypothetical protein